jgi:hypothetical protein
MVWVTDPSLNKINKTPWGLMGGYQLFGGACCHLNTEASNSPKTLKTHSLSQVFRLKFRLRFVVPRCALNKLQDVLGRTNRLLFFDATRTA